MLMFYLTMLDDEADRLVFGQIYLNCAKDMYKRAYRILHKKEDAEDAVQDTWEYVYENIHLFRNMEEIRRKSYILGIVKNQSLMILRRKRREARILCDIDEVDETSLIDDRELYDICGDYDKAIVRECIEMLGEPYSDVLLYYYYHEHTLKEISRIMNLNESTVGSRLTRGREKLIRLLTRRGLHD